MRKLVILFALIVISLNGYAQTYTTAQLGELLEKEEYDKIISASAITDKYDAEALYYLAEAYNAKNDLEKCMQALNGALAKDPRHMDALALKAAVTGETRGQDEALKVYYQLKTMVSKGNGPHLSTLFNIGMLEYQMGRYDKSVSAYNELLRSYPEDYFTYAKLTQVYYAQKQYDKAAPYKKKLYEAHAKGLLKDNLKDMFCIDQFKWKDKLVQVYERYQSGKAEKIYEKHRFYVLDKDDNVERKIVTEYSPVAVEMGFEPYVLCVSAKDYHATYGIGFTDNSSYEDMKAAVMQVLEDKIQPVASSRPKK